MHAYMHALGVVKRVSVTQRSDASEISVMKRPACATASLATDPLSESNLSRHTEELEAQNDKLNLCVRSCMKLLDTNQLQAEEAAHNLSKIVVTGYAAKLRDLSKASLIEAVEAMKGHREVMRSLLFDKAASTYTNEKVDALQAANSTLTDTKDLIADAKKQEKKGSSVAGSVAG